MFKKTQEYKDKLDTMKTLRQEMLNKYYYIVLEDKFGNYNVKKKGFWIDMGQIKMTLNNEKRMTHTPRSIYRFYFPALPVEYMQDVFFGDALIVQYLFLKMDECKGLEIENDKVNTKIFFIFKIDNKEYNNFVYKFDDVYKEWYKILDKLLPAGRIRLVVANTQTGKVYYNKLFDKK